MMRERGQNGEAEVKCRHDIHAETVAAAVLFHSFCIHQSLGHRAACTSGEEGKYNIFKVAGAPNYSCKIFMDGEAL